jgi:hypothetical protein
MTAINHQLTLSSIDTLFKPMEVAHPVNMTLPTAPTVVNSTTTLPVTATSGAEAGLVFGGMWNYAKIQPLVSVASQAFTLHVIGWSKDLGGNWRPFLITTVAVTASGGGTGQSVNGTTLFPGLTYSKTNGDCKMFAGNAAICNGGGILVDILGFERVEVVMSVASGTVTGNCLVSFI